LVGGTSSSGKESRPLTGRIFADEKLSRAGLKKRKIEEALDARRQERDHRVICVRRDEAAKESEKLMLETLNGMREEFKGTNKHREAKSCVKVSERWD